MADSKAEMTSCWVTEPGSMIPFPTVDATAVPLSAPMKFIVAAISTAWSGERTRVATTVAIAFAVSWKPFT